MPTQTEKKELLETVARMEERIHSMAEDIRELKDSIPNWVKASTILFGTDDRSGVVYEVRTIKERLQDIETWKTKFTAKVSLISSGISILIGAIVMVARYYLFGGK